MSDELLPRRDVFGEEVVSDSHGPDLISPFWQTQSRNGPVVVEMLRLGQTVSAPGRQHSVNGVRVDYTPEEYDRYHQIAGRLTYNGLQELITSREYSLMDDEARERTASRVIREARAGARGVLADPGFELPGRGVPVNLPY